MQPSGDFSIYIHVPFCTKKCPYCHFYVILDTKRHKDLYIEGLKREWELSKSQLPLHAPISIFFGGGTPSLLAPDVVGEILSWFRAHTAEITLEANPESVTYAAMQAYREAGINRVSMGVQSLDNALLQKLGRTHCKDEAIQAVHTLKKAGIENISIDLLYEVPGQKATSWETTLQIATELPITHLSIYNLTIEPHTVFYKRRKQLVLQLPSERVALSMLKSATRICEDNGFKRYEISAFAKPGFQSKHNLGYWTGRPFLGLGPSAWSYWNGCRFKKVANINRWAKSLLENKIPIEFSETLDPDAHKKELIAIGLRLVEGIDLAPLTPLTSELEKTLEKLCTQNLLIQDGNSIRLTDEGLRIHDAIAIEII